MTSWIIFATEAAAAQQAAAIDVALGYPRDETPALFGAGRHKAGRVHTETHCAIVRLADGRVAIQIDERVERLHGRIVEIEGGEAVAIDTSTATGLASRDGATAIAPRGGLLGSPDGKPA